MIDDTQANDDVVVKEATDVEATEVTEVVTAAALSIQDLANLKNIIDVASQRGAFRTNEFTVVGATYTKLSNFIASVTPAAPVDESVEEVTDEVVADEEATSKE